MSKTNISVSEADIDDDLIRQQTNTYQTTSGNKLSGFSSLRMKKPKLRLSPLVVIVLFLVVAAIVGSVLGYQKYTSLKQENQRLSNPQAAAQNEANRIKSEVAQLIELPNEDPTIATVVDAEKLRTQPFFINAQNGDRVLLFAQAKKAILYRPSTKKLVEVAPLNIASNGANVAGASTTTPTSTSSTTKKP